MRPVYDAIQLGTLNSFHSILLIVQNYLKSKSLLIHSGEVVSWFWLNFLDYISAIAF